MIYHVAIDGSNENAGTEAAPWRTVRFAAKRVEPGDEVVIGPGVYDGDYIEIDVPSTTWRAADMQNRPVMSGGYGRELLNDKGKLSKPPGEFPNGGMYKNWWLIKAANVTVQGVRFADIPGRGVLVQAGDVLIQDCDFDWLYSEGINVAPDSMIDNVTLDGCQVVRASCMELDPTLAQSMPYRPDPNVAAIRMSKTRNGRVLDCTVRECYGEGINIGKGDIGVLVEDCSVTDCGHKHLNQNHSQDVLFRACWVEHTGHPEFWRGGHVGGGFGCNDEDTGGNWPVGKNIRYENCVVKGTDNFFRIDNQWKQERLTGIEIVNCTFIATATTRTGALVQESNGQQNRGTIENCIFDFTAAPADIRPAAGSYTGGISWRNNVWSIAPAGKYRGPGDRIGDPRLDDWMLTAESVLCIDQASYTVAAPADDYLGEPRGVPADIGAHELEPEPGPDPEPDPLAEILATLEWTEDEPYVVLPMPPMSGRSLAIWLDEGGLWRAAVSEHDRLTVIEGVTG